MNNAGNKISVAVIDDDINILKDISILLGDYNRFEFSGAYKCCNEALNNFAQKVPHTLLLDLNLKEGSGIDFIPSLLSCSPELKIIIYTNYYSHEKAVETKEAGAKGYILKNIQIKSLYESIINIYNGSEVWPEELIQDTNDTSKSNTSKMLRFFRKFIT